MIVSGQLTQSNTAPINSMAPGKGFINSTAAAMNILQLIFSMISYKEGEAQQKMVQVYQNTAVSEATKMWDKGLLEAIGTGVLGVANMVGGGISFGAMGSSALSNPDLEAEIKNIDKYQNALKGQEDLRVEDDGIEMQPLSRTETLDSRIEELTEGEINPRELDLNADRDAILTMTDPEKDILGDKLQTLRASKEKELADFRQGKMQAASAYANASGMISQGVGNVLKSGLDVGANEYNYAAQLLNTAKQLNEKTTQDLEQDRKNNAQTVSQLQELEASIARAQTTV